MSSIQLIVFDLDGVVVQPPLTFRQLRAEQHGITDTDSLPFFAGPFNQCLIGQADLKTEIKPYLDQWNWQGSVDEFLDLWFTTEHHLHPQTLQLISDLQQSGHTVVAATNQEQYRTDYLRQQMGLDHLFDDLYSSAEMGIKKPHSDFYQHIQAAHQLLPSQILFVDDDQENVAGAKDFGWHAHYYTSHPELIAFLSQHQLVG